MRSREEIEKETINLVSSIGYDNFERHLSLLHKINIEVCLDIRDLLIKQKKRRKI